MVFYEFHIFLRFHYFTVIQNVLDVMVYTTCICETIMNKVNSREHIPVKETKHTYRIYLLRIALF